MNLSSGYPFSLIKNGLINSYPALENDIKSDITIIGGGISGALMAYYLCKHDIPCALVDARSIGLGSTCASTSMLQYELDMPLHQLINKVGREAAERAYKLCAESIDTLEEICKEIGFADFKKQKSLYFAAYKKDVSLIEEEYKARKYAGFQVSLLQSDEISKSYDIVAPNAILSEKAAYIDAYKFTHALLSFCRQKGLTVYDRTKVESISYEKQNVLLKTEKGYIIRTKKLINATGYEVTEFINKKIVKLHATYAIASESLSEQGFAQWNTNTLYWNTADPYLYLRSTADKRILIGGRDENFYNPKQRDALLPKKTKQLLGDFKRLFPNDIFKKEFSWCGTFGTTSDSLPYIGTYPPTANTFYALGFGGNGITFSVIAAQIIVDLLCDYQNPDAAIFSFTRK